MFFIYLRVNIILIIGTCNILIIFYLKTKFTRDSEIFWEILLQNIVIIKLYLNIITEHYIDTFITNLIIRGITLVILELCTKYF